MKIKLLAIAALATFVLSGCATMTKESDKQNIQFDSDPQYAEIYIRDANDNKIIYKSQTPTRVDLTLAHKYGVGKTYKISVAKKGYEDAVFLLKPTQEKELYGLGNFIFGGVPGWFIVDPFSGAMWNLKADAKENMVTKTTDSNLLVHLKPVGSSDKVCKKTCDCK